MGHTATLGVGRAYGVARRLGRDHPHVQIGTGNHLVVMHIETVGKGQGRALFHVGLNVVGVNAADLLIGQQHHDHIGGFHSVGHRCHFQAGFFHFVPARATRAQSHQHLDAAVVEVLRVGMPLRAIANDGHGLAFDDAQVTVFIVINLHDFSWVIKGWERGGLNQTRNTRSPRPMPQAPVRTVSKMADRSKASRKASFLDWSPVTSMV